jgi:hypothetical protein
MAELLGWATLMGFLLELMRRSLRVRPVARLSRT